MIVSTYPTYTAMSGLGFSLKPPKWLRNAVSSVIGSPNVSVKTTVPTDMGPVPVTQDSLQKIIDMIKQAKVSVNVGPKPASTNPAGDAGDFVRNQVPGGWATVAGIGIGTLLLVAMISRGGSR